MASAESTIVPSQSNSTPTSFCDTRVSGSIRTSTPLLLSYMSRTNRLEREKARRVIYYQSLHSITRYALRHQPRHKPPQYVGEPRAAPVRREVRVASEVAREHQLG